MKHIDIKDIMSDASYLQQDVTVCGWVRTSRDSKTMAFAELNDGTTFKHLQIVINKNDFADTDLKSCLALGSSLKVVGTVVPSAVNKEGGVEINAKEITLLGACPSDYPLQKKRHTMEYLRTMPQLRTRQHVQRRVPRPLRPCRRHP